MTLPDAYWEAAAEAALAALDEADYVLTPADFFPVHERFAPLEYSWGLKGTGFRLAFCCPKDDVDRIAPWLASRRAAHYRWSNEVFVLGAGFAWTKQADAESKRHLVAWLERLERYRRGIPARKPNERALTLRGGQIGERLAAADEHEQTAVRARVSQGSKGRRILIVGASNMGNVGDDLLAEVLADLLRDADADADIYASSPDIDPFRIASYDAVVVGGGGLIYASRDGSNESQNIANYLKFGPIGRQLRVPTALIGIGDQDHAGGLDRDEITKLFARFALSQFQTITTRDANSLDLLRGFGAKNPRPGSDLLFSWTRRARSAVKPTVRQAGRIALAGELYRFKTFAQSFGNGDGPLARHMQEADFDVLVMSDDDVSHAERAQNALSAAGASAAIVDLRGRDFEALVFLFGSYSGVVTTRFHALVLAAMIGVPVLALDVPGGKCARLLLEIEQGASLIVEQEQEGDSIARLHEALQGNIPRIPAERVGELAKQARVHRRQMRAFLGVTEALPAGARAENALAAPRETPAESRPPLPVRLPVFPEKEEIPLCWAASTRKTSGFANLGDSLSAVMVAALAGRPVKHTAFDQRTTKLVAVGSIGHAIRDGIAVVWGTGVSIRGGILAQNVPITRFDVRAIRGEISAQHYRDFGIRVPDVFGDPVWMLPSIVDEPVEKKYELGVIPHIRDVAFHHPEAPARSDSLRYVVDEADAGSVALINTWHEPTWDGLLAKLKLIRSCRRIVSQSFHGVVIAEAYGIPVLNFRHKVGAANGALRIDLNAPCTTDPRVWEFYKAGRQAHRFMYSQKRDQRTDWAAVVDAVDRLWEPFEYDPAALIEAFPTPIAYDPLRERVPSREHLQELQF